MPRIRGRKRYEDIPCTNKHIAYDEDETRATAHVVRGARATLEVDRDDGDDDREREQGHRDQQVLAEHRQRDAGGWYNLDQDLQRRNEQMLRVSTAYKEEDSQRDEDRHSERDLLVRQVKNESCEKGV